MSTTTRNGRWPHRLGRTAGRVWRGYLRGEQRAVGWLFQRGVPRHVARALPWIFKVAVFAMLLYAAFWLALILAAVVVLALAGDQHSSADEFELQFPATLDELREMPGYDPTFYNDSAHEMYNAHDKTRDGD